MDAGFAAFLAAHTDLDAVDLLLTDASGTLRGKRIRGSQLGTVLRNGRYLPESILGLDVTGRDVEETRLIWDDGDADRLCRAVPGTLVEVPWMERPAAQVLLTMHAANGSPFHADPRQVLAGVVAQLDARGLHPVVAVEMEFYLLDRERDAAGRPLPSRSPRTGTRPDQPQVYGIAELDDVEPFLAELSRVCAVQGLPADTAISEYAPGQYEINLRHRADALKAADEAVMFKRAVKAVARRHGMLASFMAKPFSDLAGSGMHLHLSFADGQGRNRFADPDGGDALLRHAIGGMAATMADAMAIFAPTGNAWRRFQTHSYAPVAPTWGVNNRTVGLRVPLGPPETRHVEHRICGADANPYLALAAVLAGAAHGIASGIDPGPAVTGNGYEQPMPPLPKHWHTALDALDASAGMREALGPRFVDVFLAIKRHEMRLFQATVTDLDWTLYLETA
jgi:glutamine synthetase